MTKVGRIIEEEKRQAVAKAEDEKRQALKDKQRALKQAQKEKKRADRAEQATRESVLNMLRRNYPTEEIASIVPGFSQDDIEAMKK